MLTKRLTDGLYTEAMLLADEVRTYFDSAGRDVRDGLDPMTRVLFSCESLKITTRLMHVIAWLLTRRAVEVGELSADGGRDSSRRLGLSVATEAATLAQLPSDAQRYVAASIDLHRRAARIEAGEDESAPTSGPARLLIHRLQKAF